MKTTWNNKQGNRDRQARACLVTEDGMVYRFTGASILGVCCSRVAGFEKKGKWSNTTFTVFHHETTVLVSWHDDWDIGQTWPQLRWETGFLWLAQRAPALSRLAFERFIRSNWPKTASRWDAVAKSEAEFGLRTRTELEAELETCQV